MKKENKLGIYGVDRLVFPNAYKVKRHYSKVDGKRALLYYTVQIVDDELDPYDVEISYDEIRIHTKDYTHISLTRWHIDFLARAYNKFHKEIKDND